MLSLESFRAENLPDKYFPRSVFTAFCGTLRLASKRTSIIDDIVTFFEDVAGIKDPLSESIINFAFKKISVRSFTSSRLLPVFFARYFNEESPSPLKSSEYQNKKFYAVEYFYMRISFTEQSDVLIRFRIHQSVRDLCAEQKNKSR